MWGITVTVKNLLLLPLDHWELFAIYLGAGSCWTKPSDSNIDSDLSFIKSEEQHQCQDYSTRSQVLWAQTCFHAIVHSFASHLSGLSSWAPAAGRLMLHVVCALSSSLREVCAHKTCFALAGFCFWFMWTNSRSKSVLAWEGEYGKALWGPAGWRNSLCTP